MLAINCPKPLAAKDIKLVKLNLHCNGDNAGLDVCFILPFTCLHFSGRALCVRVNRRPASTDSFQGRLKDCLHAKVGEIMIVQSRSIPH